MNKEPINAVVVSCDDTPRVETLSLLRDAISGGIDVESLRELYKLHKEETAARSKRDYVSAMAAAKAELPATIHKSKQSTGPTKNRYAELSDIVAAAVDVLARHGLSHCWRTEQTQGDRIRVTCIITHEGGHSEEFALSAAPDTGPGRNVIQAIGSTVTYLQRYTLKSALGIAESGDDSDGNVMATDKQLARLRSMSADERLSDAWRNRIAQLLVGSIGAAKAVSVIQKAKAEIERTTGEKYAPPEEG